MNILPGHRAARVALVAGMLGVLPGAGIRAAHGATSPDPCALLTPAQITAVTGLNPGPGTAIGTVLCRWEPPGQPAIGAKSVALTLISLRAFAAAKMPISDQRVTKTPVSGVGDEAVFGTLGTRTGTLTVRKGETAFVVHVSGFPLEQLEGMEKTLALEVLARL